MPVDAALGALESAGVPAAPIYSAADILADKHMAERGSIVSVADPDLGPTRLQGPIPRLSETPGSIRHLGHSQIGNSTDEVFRRILGLSDRDLEALRAESVI